MTTYLWLGSSGNWTTPADWNQDAVPNAITADVTLGGTGTYDVTLASGNDYTAGGVALTDPNATFTDAGQIYFGGGTLALDAGTLALTGNLSDGTLDIVGGTLSLGSGATLNAMTVLGTLDLSAANTTLTVETSLTVETPTGGHPGTINLTGGGSTLLVFNSMTLDNIVIGMSPTLEANGNTARLENEGTLTLGSQALLTIGESSFNGGFVGTALINDGTIVVAGGIPAFSNLNPPEVFANENDFVNAGTLAISGNEERFVLAGNTFLNTGLITIGAGSLLGLDPPAGSSFVNQGTIVNDGQLGLAGYVTLNDLGTIISSPGKFGSIGIGGTLDLGGGTLDVEFGSAFGDSELNGTVTDGTVKIGAGIDFPILPGSTIDGTLDLSTAGVTLGVQGSAFTTLSSGGLSTILLTGNGSSLYLGSETLENAAVMLGTLGASSTITGGSDGALTLGGNEVLTTNSGTGVLAGASIVNSGSIIVSGSGLLKEEAAAFTNLGTITTSGDGEFLAPFNVTNLGLIDIGAGSIFQAGLGGGTFVNSGTVVVGAPYAGVIPDYVGATFTNTSAGLVEGNGLFGPDTGGQAEACTNTGTIEALGGNLVLDWIPVGAGILQIGTSATLELTVGDQNNIAFSGANATLIFGNENFQAGTLSGITAGDVIMLPGETITSASSSGTAFGIDLAGSTTALPYALAEPIASLYERVIDNGAGIEFLPLSSIDQVTLSAGATTIQVPTGQSDYVSGAGAVTVPAGISSTGQHQFTLTFIGGNEASTVTGGAGSYAISAGAGGGVFTGASAGGNVITGGIGAVTITGGGNGDLLQGGTGTSLVRAGAGSETLQGGGGTGTLVAGSGADYILADGTDTVQLSSGQVTVEGEAAPVYVASGSSTAATRLVFYGGAAVANTVNGGLGSATIYSSGGSLTGGAAGHNAIFGGAGATTITGNGGGDYLQLGTGGGIITAGSGAETLVGGGGAGMMFGGGGSDVFLPSGADSIVLGFGAATVGAGSGNTTVIGAAATNVTVGLDSSGADHFNLVFIGGTAASTVLGGAGTYYISAGAGGGVFTGGSAGDNQMFGGSGAATMTGGGNGDTINGGVGNDLLIAGAGRETLQGTGADIFDAGSGADDIVAGGKATILLGSGAATVQAASSPVSISGGTSATRLVFYGGTATNSTVAAGQGSDTIYANGGVFSGGAAGNNAIFGGTAAITITGGGTGDYLQAGAGGGLITAGAGSETLIGGGGSDTLVGGSGADVFVANGSDTVRLGTGTATVGVAAGHADIIGATTVSVPVGYSSTGVDQFNLLFNGGAGASTVQGGAGTYYVNAGAGGGVFTGGSAGGNQMFGGSGAATLIGGGSNDFLQGGTGAASLVAGAGAETLAAGAGNATLEAHAAGLDAFDFATHGAGGSYVIQSFATTDDLYFANAATATAATSLYHVAGGSGTITLTDSTRIVLVGFTGSITGSVTHG